MEGERPSSLLIAQGSSTRRARKLSKMKLKNIFLLSHHGLHAIIWSYSWAATQEEQQTVALIKNLFGEAAMKYMIILVTYKEDRAFQRDHVRS